MMYALFKRIKYKYILKYTTYTILTLHKTYLKLCFELS